MTIALIDGDIVAYRCAASAEQDGDTIAFMRASRQLQDIISTTEADEVKVFLSGSSNFRYDIYPEYKANRKDMPRPKHLQALREYLVIKWGAEVTDGFEADDALGIEASRRNQTNETAVVCSIDKDLLQLPGLHYNFVRQEFQSVDELTGWRHFYSQLVLGDKADNIPGFDGKARIKWPKFLEQYREKLGRASSSGEMYSVVRDLYGISNEEQFIRNARLLYLWRKANDQWVPPIQVETTSEERQETGVKSESIVTTQAASTPSTVPTGTKRSKGGFRSRGRSKGT